MIYIKLVALYQTYNRYMLKSQNQEEIIEEQSPISLEPFQATQKLRIRTSKYASLLQIKEFQRQNQIGNKKKMENSSIALHEKNNYIPQMVHFIMQEQQQHFKAGNQVNKAAEPMIIRQQQSTFLNINTSNIQRDNFFHLQVVKNLDNKSIIIENRTGFKQNTTNKFTFHILFKKITVVFKILLRLQDQLKIWKQMQVPMVDNTLSIRIEQYNNQQTCLKINNFQFQLMIKMPLVQKSYLNIRHEHAIRINTLELISKKKTLEASQLDVNFCSKDCQLI